VNLVITTGAWRSRLTVAGTLIVLGILACVITPSRGQAPEGAQADPSQEAATQAISRAPVQRQVTAFAILAIPDSSELDPRLATIQSQLCKVLPGFGFKLRDVQSKRIETGQSVTCDLGNGYKAETILVKSLDENGKVQLRCNLALKGTKEFSTLVRTPANQLFFYERSLKEGARVLIGVGAR
jgi:hypothetical protein